MAAVYQKCLVAHQVSGGKVTMEISVAKKEVKIFEFFFFEDGGQKNNKNNKKCFEFTAAVVDCDMQSGSHLCTNKHCIACNHTLFFFWAIFASNAINIF